MKKNKNEKERKEWKVWQWMVKDEILFDNDFFSFILLADNFFHYLSSFAIDDKARVSMSLSLFSSSFFSFEIRWKMK